jgi:hypothetical protein
MKYESWINYFNPKNSLCFFDQTMQILTQMEKSFFPKTQSMKLDKAIVGSLNYLGVYQPQNL